jgi:hypothetical protein
MLSAWALIKTAQGIGAAFRTTPGTSPASPDPSNNATPIDVPLWIWASLLGVLVAGLIAWLVYLYFRGKLAAEDSQRIAAQAEREEAAVASALDQLREKMSLPSLLDLNRLSLNRYHDIATDQANKSFRSGQRAMWIGFAWLLACLTASALVAEGERRLILGSFGILGGALAAFLGRTYLRVYETSLHQLNQFYDQPLLNSYYLSAERLATESGELQDALMRDIVGSMLATATSVRNGGNSNGGNSTRRPAGRKTTGHQNKLNQSPAVAESPHET